MPQKGNGETHQVLVADVGGTNARFALATLVGDQKPQLSEFRNYPCADYHNLDDIIAEFLAGIKGTKPTRGCIAAAGPVASGKIHLTNLGWHVDQSALQKKFKFERLILINDFAALARSTTVLEPNDLLTLHKGQPEKNGPVSIMGPGTGFGIALLIPDGKEDRVIATEGGHISFYPLGNKERKVWTALVESMGRITIETMMSGVGIMRTYRELCHLHQKTPLNYEPSTISQQALEHDDPICLETLDVFCSILGSVAGDIALVQGATGGVYLGGGILPKMGRFLFNSKFTERYLDKVPMDKLVQKIPVHLITASDPALYGAALYCR